MTICSESRPRLAAPGDKQYARILESWAEELGLDPADYGTHSMRRTKATWIYRRTKTFVPFSCTSGIRSWSRPCGISGSKSTTPWRSPNRRKSDRRVSAARPSPLGRRLGARDAAMTAYRLASERAVPAIRSRWPAAASWYLTWPCSHSH